MTKRIPTYTPNAVLTNKQKTTKKGGRERFVPHQQRISVQDVRNTSTPEGAAMVNEEFRRIALNINETQAQVEQLAAEMPKAAEAKKPVAPPAAEKKEPSATIITNITEAGNTVTSDDGSVTVSETANTDGSTNYDLDIWDYEERVETVFVANPNGFDWLPDMSFKANIAPGEQYNIVLIGTNYYVCIVDHISSTSFAADLAAGYWEAIPDWIQGGGYGCKVVDLYNVATDPVPSDIDKQVKVNGIEVGLLKEYLIDPNGVNTGRWWILTSDPIIFDDLLTITGGSGSGLCEAVSTNQEYSFVKGVDGNVYYARVQHESDPSNAPPNYEYWVIPQLAAVGYRELVNRYPPVYSSSSDFNQTDLRYITGDGWIPFLYGGKINRIIKSNEISVVPVGVLGRFQKTNYKRYEHPYAPCSPAAREKQLFYFKPPRAGSYELNCSVDLKVMTYLLAPTNQHWKHFKGMLILQKFPLPGMVPVGGDDLPFDYLSPIAVRVDIAGDDARIEGNIYSILDNRSIGEIARLYHNPYGSVPPAWAESVYYGLGVVVELGGLYYICIAAHTSAYGNDPSNPVYWSPFTSSYSPWLPGVAYVIGNNVGSTNGIAYTCREDHTSDYSNEPPNPRYWTVLTYPGGYNTHISDMVQDIKLAGSKVIHSDGGNESYFLGWYKLYFTLVEARVDDFVNHHIELLDSGKTYDTERYARIIEAKHTMDVKYLGSDALDDADPHAYEIARLF